MTRFGMYAQTPPRNDASPGRGQWDLNTSYRYISEPSYVSSDTPWFFNGVRVQTFPNDELKIEP